MTSSTTKTALDLRVIPGKKGRELLRAAEQTVSPHARDDIQSRLEGIVGKLAWKDFGGSGRVAHSAIGATGDALHLAGEPIVNQGDGLIEMMRELARLEGDNFDPQNPREAAARYFGLPDSGMAEWNTRKGEARRRFEEVAQLSQLKVYAGSRKDEATLVYLDRGIGQHPARFEETVLSLQRGLKADIPYLAGQFGHGAGLTLNFSNGGQILIGRRHPDLLDEDQDDLVGFTIIRKYRASEVGSVHPAYRYAVDAESGKPLAFEASALGDPRWHGLRRICIDYEFGAAANKIGDQASGGLYYHLDNLLPCPVLPYALRDERSSTPQSRYMQGTTARLTARARGWGRDAGKNPIHVEGPIQITVDVTAAANDGSDYGTAQVSAWIIEQENTNKGNDLFGPASAAETWALTGQMHEAFGRDHFAQKPIELDALKNHLKVNIECDGLTVDAKADIFTTSRQGTAERRAQKALRDAVDSVLANDRRLRIRDQEIKEAALRRATEGADKELERALSDFQHLFEQEVEIREGGRRKKKGKKKRKKNGTKPDIKPLEPIAPLRNEPTFLRFRKVLKKQVRVAPGAVASIQLEADAIDGYFPNEEEVQFSTVPDLGETVRVFARERLSGGRLRVHFRAAAGAAPGSAVLTASCLPSSADAPLTDSIELEIVAPDSGGGGETVRKEKRKLAPPHRVLWKEDSNGNSWADESVEWSEETIGEFKNGVALVNGDFAPFREMLDQVKMGQRQAITRLYVPPIVMSLVSLDKSEKEPPTSQSGKAIPLHADYRVAALRSVALGSVFTIRRLKKLGFGIGEPEPSGD